MIVLGENGLLGKESMFQILFKLIMLFCTLGLEPVTFKRSVDFIGKKSMNNLRLLSDIGRDVFIPYLEKQIITIIAFKNI